MIVIGNELKDDDDGCWVRDKREIVRRDNFIYKEICLCLLTKSEVMKNGFIMMKLMNFNHQISVTKSNWKLPQKWHISLTSIHNVKSIVVKQMNSKGIE